MSTALRSLPNCVVYCSLAHSKAAPLYASRQFLESPRCLLANSVAFHGLTCILFRGVFSIKWSTSASGFPAQISCLQIVVLNLQLLSLLQSVPPRFISSLCCQEFLSAGLFGMSIFLSFVVSFHCSVSVSLLLLFRGAKLSKTACSWLCLQCLFCPVLLRTAVWLFPKLLLTFLHDRSMSLLVCCYFTCPVTCLGLSCCLFRGAFNIRWTSSASGIPAQISDLLLLSVFQSILPRFVPSLRGPEILPAGVCHWTHPHPLLISCCSIWSATAVLSFKPLSRFSPESPNHVSFSALNYFLQVEICLWKNCAYSQFWSTSVFPLTSPVAPILSEGDLPSPLDLLVAIEFSSLIVTLCRIAPKHNLRCPVFVPEILTILTAMFGTLLSSCFM